MKKLLTFLLTALLAFGVGWAESIAIQYNMNATSPGTWDPGNSSGANSCVTPEGFSIYCSSSNATKANYFGWNSGNTSFTISHSSYFINKVNVYCYDTNGNVSNVSIGSGGGSITYPSTKQFNWTSGTTSVKLVTFKYSSGSQLRIDHIIVDYEVPSNSVSAPTFEPDGGTFTGSVNVTISSATEGATIYYTTDGSDPVVSRSSIANGGTVELTESCTLKAMAAKSGMEPSAIVSSQSYTITSGGGSDSKIYRKVTSTNDLTAGQKYIIVYEDGSSSVGMGEYDGSKHFSGVQNLTVSNNKVDIAGTSVLELTLGGSAGAWTLYTGSGYIQGANAVQFNIVNNATADNSKWIITNTIDETNGFVVENAQYDRYIKCYNSSSFRHYASSNGAWAYLYVQESDNTPHLLAEPNPLDINDTNEAGRRTGSILVSGQNLNNDNVGITFDNSHSTNFSSNPGYFTQSGSFTDQQVDITYTGHALSATGLARVANDQTNTLVNVNYLYTGPIYVVGNVNDKNWQTVDGVQMTRDESTGKYSVVVNAYNDGDGNAYIFFTKSISGNSYDDLGDNRFGPESGGNWGLTSGTTGIYCMLDTMANLHTIVMAPGNYRITIDPATNKFMIEHFVVNVTISPEDGTHFTGSEISGTITSEPTDATIEYSFDGTNWQPYTNGFTATVNNVGGTVTVYARATSNGVTSDVAQATYTRDAAPAPAAPTFSIGSSAVAAGTVITITAPEGCTLYVDGQEVTNPYLVTINSATTISAYCVNDEGTQSTTVSNTYTIAAVCSAEVVFMDNGSDATNATSWNAIGGEGDNNYFEAGRDYISGATDIARVYKGTTGFKFGNSSTGGTITFNLADNTEWKVNHITVNARCYDPTIQSDYQPVFTVTTSDGQSQSTQKVTSSTVGGYTLDFGGTAITSITISTNYRAYLKGFTITYECTPTVEAPVITPATGTYYEDQTVEITAGDNCTIHYTTDGSEPTINSLVYDNTFTASYTAGGTTTIKAIAVDGDGNLSEVTTEVYTWGSPAVTIYPESRNTTASSVNVTLTGSPADALVYYTTDGSTPTTESTLYSGPFDVALEEIGDQATVNAIAVYNGLTSEVASATYTRVEKVVDVNAPFFSPLQNNTYYGNQTLQIGCTTPNADIYYEIVEVSGTTAPSADNVDDPTKSSTYYDGSTINMTVGNSYYVKAIAYIGDYASTIAEGWYTIEEAPSTQYTYTNLKDFNDNCPTGVTAHFVNPVQVVYHSTYTNNGEFAEFCFLRDNTDYACVYFGKRDTHDYTIFKMGDWIDGSQISGVTNIWEKNFHIQLGTSYHEVDSWPSQAIGWSEILPEEMTNDVIVAGTAEGDNVWGHYVHLRNTTLQDVADLSATDPKHKGIINDGTDDAYYYDKFYRWSAGTCTYQGHNDDIQCLGDYDQTFFTNKQNAGATFDVYGVVDYFSDYEPPFEICPIDFLWAYKPAMNPASTTSFEPVTVNITATQPEWAAEGVVIYYKTDDMEEWAVYMGPITVNSTTTVQAYAEVPAEKTDGTNYNDMVRSEILTETYTIEGIVDPTISPESEVIEIVTGDESVTVTVTDHNEVGSGAVTTYTVNGVEYTLEAGQSVEIVVTETTTITAVSSIVSGEQTLYSNEVSETYTFVKKNSVVFDLVKTAPKEGSVYVIVNKQANMGLSTTQNENNRGSVGVMFVDDTKEKVYGNDELAQFVLEQATAGRYYFKNINGDNTGYLIVTTNDAANLNTAAEANSYAEANVSVENGNGYPATITFYYDGAPRYLRYYENGRTFSTYADGSLNKEVYLYGLEATPLAYIESNETPVEPVEGNKQVLVSDELIGVWAVVNPEKGINQLWAKDQGNLSIDKTSIVEGQTDYVKDIMGLQTRDWDQSNWVVLDFSGLNGESAFNYESRTLESATVKGYYTNDLNYTIKLTESPIKVNENPVEGYPGYDGNYAENSGDGRYYYNHYTPANFLKDNLNAPYGDGAEAGPASPVEGKKIFFMNPKVQEVAQVWGVWMGNDRFDVLECNVQPNGTSVNGYDLSGSFVVNSWDYNMLGMDENNNPRYGCPITDDNPNALVEGEPYLFHVIITRNDRNYGGPHRAPGAAADDSFGVSPADLPSGTVTPTAVKNVTDAKQVVSVRYFNVMGMESEKPFEGVNIVVTSYSDGSISTYKVLR